MDWVARVWLLGLALAVCAPSAFASDDALPAGLAGFVDQFRAAASGEDAASAFARLAHPAAQACADDPPGSWNRIVAQYRRVFGHGLEVAGRAWRPTTPAELERMKQMPGPRFAIDPEGRVQIDWVVPGRTRASNLHVARHDGDWRWVHVCLGGDTR